MSKDMNEQLKVAHQVVDVVDGANRKICVTLLRYIVDKPENYFAQARFFAKKKEDEEFQHIVQANYKPEEFIFIFDVLISVIDKDKTNQPVFKVL